MNIIKNIKQKIGPSQDYKFKTMILDKQSITLIFNETLTNSITINDFILRELKNINKKELGSLDNYLPNSNIKKIKEQDILDNLNNGCLIIITKNKIYSIEVKIILDRGVTTIQSELSITGPKDSFTENFNTNINLIRKRLKTTNLYCENITMGKNTKTKIGILYMNNIVNKHLPKLVKEKLLSIDIDGIIDSSYLKRTLENKSLFPTIMLTERPDKSVMALLEGKIIIIVDMSPYTLILPSFFIDFFHTTDDYYQKNLNVSFIRIIRLFAFIIAIFTPAIYIATTTRNYNLLSYNLLMMLKAGRSFVPFPAYIEAMFMIICFEILKETDFRMSTTAGSAVSILGGLILGDAAVSAGIVSPIMIIVIAISSIAGLIFPSIELGNALRGYKILLLILSTILGIYGVIIGGIYLLYELITTKTFTYNYLTPFIPYEQNEIKDSIIKIKNNKRNKKLTNNITRGKNI